ncbi:sigma-70 family [Proteiniphilum saccharofermentans]|uniref:Sigma-70 family n=1 Tax=Proteiniphilum saccharofermentans TaxID=1642647 RepID=A0A1R3T245_9BACT|nr:MULTISPECIES: sigma-70 family RNA polymerase sigma factor [Proteiniphilum]SCD21781.1 sigma-70 family [Proteiniphilum saccharofermentans]SFL16685.1 RNA polymerase sigma factor, sigma-70 family [Porphyromonadaceae bacterium KH3CP3RA]
MKKSDTNDPVLLWNSFRNGNDDAYILIYRTYVRDLYFQGLQFTKNKEIIKDCIQDVFTKLYKYRSNLGDTDNIKYYLLTSMRNQLLTAISKEKIYMDVEREDTNAGNLPEKNIEDILIEREEDRAMGDKINLAMSLLTDRQREAVRYRYIDCLTPEEICRLMDLNYQSLQNILSRSLKKIRQHLKKDSLK